MTDVDLLIIHASQLCAVPAQHGGPQRGARLGDLGVIEDGALAVSRSGIIGSLEIGKQADIVILDVPDYRHLGYRFGTNLVYTVIKRGRVVVQT